MIERLACLTLDLEPDCGGRFNTFQALDNMSAFLAFFERIALPLTVFVTGRIFQERPGCVEALAQFSNVEFGVHSWSHRIDAQESEREINLGTESYTRFFGKAPLGYRAPQGNLHPGDTDLLLRLGYRYDSSVLPTWRPGVYNNLTKPNKPYHYNSGLSEIPITVLRPFLVPLGLTYFRLLGLWGASMLLQASRLPDIVIVYFHLHDLFFDPRAGELKGIWKNIYQRNVQNGTTLLQKIITTLKQQGYNFKLMACVEGTSEIWSNT